MTTKAAREEVWTPASIEPLADVREAFEVVALRDREALYEPGALADRLYLVRSGRFRLARPRAGQDATHAFVSVGAVFGGDSVGPDGRVQEAAVSLGDSEVWSFGIAHLPRLFDARPQLAVDVVRGLSLRQRETSRRLEAIAAKEVPARLAGQLLALAESLGEPSQNGGTRDIRGITQQDLADLVGASRSFVSTLVNEYKRHGILAAAGRTLVIRDAGRLALLAAEDGHAAAPRRRRKRANR